MVIGIDASRAATRQRTGTEAYALFLIRALISRTAQTDHSLRLYFNQPPDESLFTKSENVERVIIPFPRMWSHIRLARELAGRPPDVFFTPAHVIPFSYQGPSVATIHDLGFEYFPAAHTNRQRLYLRWSTGHNSRRSRRIAVDSQATKDDLIRLYAVEEVKIDVIYPGIDPELRPIKEFDQLAAVQAKYGITSPYLLYLGTIQPRKNLERLTEAFVASGVKAQLVLAGKVGWHAHEFLKRIEDLGALAFANDPDQGQKSIVLPGFVADEDKAALISGAEALLYPSLYEGFGFPVAESNVCGTPVLCSNTSSLPEIAGEAALMVDPLDTRAIARGIERITVDEVYRQTLIAAGYLNSKRFDWDQAADQLLQTLERTVE